MLSFKTKEKVIENICYHLKQRHYPNSLLTLLVKGHEGDQQLLEKEGDSLPVFNLYPLAK